MNSKIIFFLVLAFSYIGVNQAQDMHLRYEKAEKLLPRNVKNKLFKRWVEPNYIKGTTLFWYTIQTEKGKEYWLLDYAKKTKRPAFNHELLAARLSEIQNKTLNPYKLDLQNLKFSNDLKTLVFNSDTLKLKCKLSNYELVQLSKPEKFGPTESISPDSLFLASIRENNIWIKNRKTQKEFQLTEGGTDLYPFGGNISWYFIQNESKKQKVEFEIDVSWSKDSKKLLIARYDRREAEKLYLYKSLPHEGWRSEVYSYYRPLAGDSLVPTVEYYIAHIESRKLIKADLKPLPTFTDYGSEWSSDTESIFKLHFKRGWNAVQFTKTDASTCKTKLVYSEKSESYVDPMFATYHFINDEKEMLWLSEKDGWNHIYRISTETGAVLNQVTKGNFVVRNIKYIDEKTQKIYFTANGKEPDSDPYYEYLYVTDYNGKAIKLLTPEKAYHNINFTEDKNFFIDNFSRVDMPNKAVLRRVKDGKIAMLIEETQTEVIDSMGLRYPEPFVTKARDGKTDIYGVIYRPTDFDPGKMYPIIDYSYSGPQTIVTPKTFGSGILNMNYALAELGFIVVTVDGMGSAFRSKEFHDFSYKNLGDIGGPDHISAIKQLADKYPYMDTTKVGIYGHSAGGYDAARALIAYNYFYKVAVAGAGNHDHRIAKAWWPEVYMGYPADKHYDEQSNILNAAKLKGKLLLAHGDLDNNVNPAGSTRFAAELVGANKDFELLIIPGVDHGGLWWNSYFIRKRWDFFVRNLMGAEPPYEYKIK